MKKLVPIILILVIISGCRVYRDYPREFERAKFQDSDPTLEICLTNLKNRVADADPFYVSDFLVTQEMSSLKSDETYPQIDIEPERFYEMVDVIKNNYETNTEAFCEKISILEYEEGSSLPLKLLTAFTVGTPCLVGMPANWTSTKVIIQHECYDDKGDLITSAQSEGYNKTWVAMYWVLVQMPEHAQTSWR
jgi:hypothetical protein